MENSIKNSWKVILKNEFSSPYFLKIKENLKKAQKNNIVYPPINLIFNAFNLTSFENVKVVILGQDPYHGQNQAMGLSFSVLDNEKIPPSLKNIFKELQNDLNLQIPNSGNLTKWAKQGVFLLNSILSVNANLANSHFKFGWQIFTDNVIKILNEKKSNLVFMLWGNYAKNKINLIDSTKHLILTAAHPSPLARKGFSGCRHFSKCNNYLKKYDKTPIEWQL